MDTAPDAAGGPARWGPTLLIAAVVATFLAGFPLLELVVEPESPQAAAAVVVVPEPEPAPEVAPEPSTESVSFEPATEWVEGDGEDAVEPGLETVTNGAASFAVEHFAGPCETALPAALDAVQADEPSVPDEGRPYATATITGIVRTWSGPTSEGLVFTACEGGVGVSVIARGPIGSLSADGFAGVFAMLDSVEVE